MIAGFNMYQKHKGVVVAAVQRLNVPRRSALFEDLVEEGMLVYLDYFDQYRESMRYPAQVAKFNRLAGNAVYLTLLNRQRKTARHDKLDAAVAKPEPVITADLSRTDDDLAVADQLRILVAVLTPAERAVLIQLYDKDQTVSAAAHNLGYSRTKVSQLRRSIGEKYHQFIG